jgi:LysM repeat protein
MRAKLIVIMILVLLATLLTPGAGQAAPGKLGGAVHVVQWGENLASIALQYGTTVAALCQANGLANPDMIYIGQELVVPGAGGMPPLPQQGGTYTVRSGDTLTNIAFRNNTSVEALMQINNLPGGFIFAGQQLIVPGTQSMPVAPQSGPMAARSGPMAQGPVGLPLETVKPGDTLSAMAFRYGTTVNDIMQANDLYNPWIFPGQKLAMPGRAAGPKGQAFEGPAGTDHVVSVGETLAGIALRYGTTVQSILQANGLSRSNFIMTGQKLVIPGVVRSPQESGVMPPGAMTLQGANPGAPVAPRITGQNASPFVGGPTNSNNPGVLIGPAVPPVGAQQLAAGQVPQGYNNPVGGPQGPGASQGYGVPPLAGQGPDGYNNPLGGPQGPVDSQGYGVPPLAGQGPQGYNPLGGPQGPVDSQGYGVPPFVGGQVPVLPEGPNPVQPPAMTTKWVGRLVSMTQPEDNRYPGVLRVQAGGAAGMQITVSKKPGSWSTTGFTGGKPEYGYGTAEFAPIGSGYHDICLDGQNACVRINIAPHSLTYVEFDQAPN